ncbi:MAG: DUF4442 domain-containing protein [Chitinophagaceae bacterium]|nr:DUF4442 domain-containing protein [Chitinophagaceae bacterium]
MNENTAAFTALMKHPLKFRWFLFTKLPSAYFTGVRIREADGKKCVVTVPYKWFSQNPFRSTYFASLAMAAELSTGALSMANLYKRKPSVSMLLVKLEAEYFKKAIARTTFTCLDGDLIRQAIEESIQTGEARSVRAESVGRSEAGEEIARFFITWSYKVRSENRQ